MKRKINRDSVWSSLITNIALVIPVTFAHISAMVHFENLSVWDSLWVTVVTGFTVGYGDISASSVYGQAASMMFMLFGIVTFTNIVMLLIDFRNEMRHKKRTGKWAWNKMKNHIVIFNAPDRNVERYFVKLITQMRESEGLETCDIILCNQHFNNGLPNELLDLGVVLYSGRLDEEQTFKGVSLEKAKGIVVLSASMDLHNDSIAFDAVDRLSIAKNPDANIVVEIINDQNRKRVESFKDCSAIRPVRSYPEMVVRALTSPGTEKILENLFSTSGDEFKQLTPTYDYLANWKCVMINIINEGLGTPVGYITHSGKIVCNPELADYCEDLKNVFVIMKDDKKCDSKLFTYGYDQNA